MTSILFLDNQIDNNLIKDLDTNLLPKILYRKVINRNDNGVLKILVNNPDLCNKLMIFYRQLKLSYSLYSQNKCNCLTKINWNATNYSDNYLSFLKSLELQRYIILQQKVSNLFYLSVQLGKFLQTIKLFKFYKSNNKYFCSYEWLKYINYNKFSNLVPYQINFNLFNSLTKNDSYSLEAQNFLRHYILLFKL